jgi:hypothetical protein
MNAMLLLRYLLIAPADSVQKQIGIQAHMGFITPHAPDLQAISQTRPVGLELTYSRTALQQAAFEGCNCFARIGGYVNYFTYNNPAELGRTMGARAFFEPLINYGKPIFFGSHYGRANIPDAHIRCPNQLEHPDKFPATKV